MDWSACVICQIKKGGLKCPADSNEKNGLNIYANFLEIVKRFSENNVHCLVDLKGIECADEFMKNRAKWHKSCRLKLTPSKLEKELSRKRKLEEDGAQRDRKSRRLNVSPHNKEKCIFCLHGKRTTRDKLHECSTTQLDAKLIKNISSPSLCLV